VEAGISSTCHIAEEMLAAVIWNWPTDAALRHKNSGQRPIAEIR
jgi:hypothetical protein